MSAVSVLMTSMPPTISAGIRERSTARVSVLTEVESMLLPVVERRSPSRVTALNSAGVPRTLAN